MQVDLVIVGIFSELLEMASNLLQTRSSGQGYIGYARTPYEKVSPGEATEWGMRCLSLLRRVFGSESDYYEAFKEESSGFASFSNYDYVMRAFSILKAAKADFENGYLSDTRKLLEAEVFDDFLEQASHLLENGYSSAAAVIAGTVLEEGLRRLCQQNNVTLHARPTIGPMNDALAKMGLYNNVVKQRILALAAIRNHAAHGQSKEFTGKDVEQMIDWVKIFMENSFGNARMSN